MIARDQKLLERYLVADGIILDRTDETLWCDGNSVQLTGKTFGVLQALMAHAPALVTKDRLIDRVWGGKAVSDAVVTTAIKSVRRALDDDARAPKMLKTVHGRGYRFVLDVAARETISDDIEPSLRTPPNAIPIENPPSPVFDQKHVKFAAIITVAAVAVIMLGLSLYPGEQSKQFATIGDHDVSNASIAVLPFDDFSPENDHAWFADGLAEEILDALAKTPNLLVASRRSSFGFRDTDDDISDIAEKLGVSHVIEGSVRSAGDEMRITVQLIRASDGYHAWSETYDRPVSAAEVFDVQEEVSNAIAAQLGFSPTQLQLDQPITNSLDAFHAYQLAKTLIRLRSLDAVRQSIIEFERALSIDENFGAAYAGLAEAHLYAAAYSGRDVEDSEPMAHRFIEKALNLNPNSTDALSAAAFHALVTRNYNQALDYSSRALNSNPNDVEALQRKAIILMNLSRVQDAAKALREARLRDPLSPIILANLTDLELALGNVGTALSFAQENLRWNAGHGLAESGLAQVHYGTGDYSNAHQRWRNAVERNPKDRLTAERLGTLYWRLGMYQNALNLSEASSWRPRAATYFSRGDIDQAVDLAAKHENAKLKDLSAFIAYYWAGEKRKAYALAEETIRHWRLLDEKSYAEREISHVIPLIIILETESDDRASILRENMAEFFDGKRPGDITVAQELYVGAAWQMVNSNFGGALAWIDEALDRGLVPREIAIDPVFDEIRDSSQFQLRLDRMERNAQTHRQLIEDTTAINTR